MTASLEVIKSMSRKPASHIIVKRWLESNYGSESIQKSKRKRVDMETEETAEQSGVGGSLIGSINIVISPAEQGKVTEEGMPVVLMDAGHNDRQAVQTLKRRKVEGLLQVPVLLRCLDVFPPVNDGDLIN